MWSALPSRPLPSPRRRAGLFATVLTLVLAAVALAPAARAQTAPPDRAAIEAIVRDYLLENPELMLEVLRNVQRHQEEQASERVRESIERLHGELYDNPEDGWFGAAKADVTVVEFFDYRCGYCRRNHEALADLVKADPRVRVVLKEFPILGPESVLAARVALAARKQGKYMAVHDALMRGPGQLTEERIFALAQEAGADVKRLRQDMRAPEIAGVLQRNYRAAEMLGIKGTPGFVIGDAVVASYMDADDLRTAVAEARRACKTC